MFLSVIGILGLHLGGSYRVPITPPEANPLTQRRIDQNHGNHMWPLSGMKCGRLGVECA